MFFLHRGQLDKEGAHITQLIKCPQGRNTTPILLSMQMLHNFSSLSRLFSCSKSERAKGKFDFPDFMFKNEIK